MQSILMAAARAVALEPPYDSVFTPLIGDLVDALASDDPSEFLTAVEGRAHTIASDRSLRLADVFLAIQSGMRVFRGALGVSPAEALIAARVERLEGEALLRAGVGYAEGLEETVDHLSQAVVALSPTDPLTGLMKASEIERQLAVELDRCRRMELGLGAFLVAVDADEPAHRPRRGEFDEVLQRAARLVGESLRRYDAVGRLAETEFLAVLPDVSRHGVQAVVERLRHELSNECARDRCVIRFALAHLDEVDLEPYEIAALLAAGLDRSRGGDDVMVWV